MSSDCPHSHILTSLGTDFPASTRAQLSAQVLAISKVCADKGFIPPMSICVLAGRGMAEEFRPRRKAALMFWWFHGGGFRFRTEAGSLDPHTWSAVRGSSSADWAVKSFLFVLPAMEMGFQSEAGRIGSQFSTGGFSTAESGAAGILTLRGETPVWKFPKNQRPARCGSFASGPAPGRGLRSGYEDMQLLNSRISPFGGWGPCGFAVHWGKFCFS